MEVQFSNRTDSTIEVNTMIANQAVCYTRTRRFKETVLTRRVGRGHGEGLYPLSQTAR